MELKDYYELRRGQKRQEMRRASGSLHNSTLGLAYRIFTTQSAINHVD
jgi:hypothetical protein